MGTITPVVLPLLSIKIEQDVKHQKYDDALNRFEKLFRVLPKLRTVHQNEFSALEKMMFDFISKELDVAIAVGDVEEIKAAFEELKRFKFVDPGKYNNYKERVNSVIAEDYFERAKDKYSERSYYDVIAYVNMAISLNRRNTKYRSLYDNAREKIYRQKLKSLKNSRHHIMVFQFGGGIQTHKEFGNEFIDDDNTKIVWMPSFSMGLFAKYGIKSQVSMYGRDHSRSNIIGFKYTFVDPKLQYSFDVNFERKELSYWQEIEFVVGFATSWLVETGLANNRFSTSAIIKDVNYYTASITKRFYTHPVELTMQFKTYVSPQWNFYPVLKIGLFFDINLIRKISLADKKKIKQEIVQYR